MRKIRITLALAAVAALTVSVTSCQGRTQENATPNGDTVEVSGGEVVMPDASDSPVIAESPAEAQATDAGAAKPAENTQAPAAAEKTETPASDVAPMQQ